MGLFRRILDGGHARPDDVPVLGRFREERPCSAHYSERSNGEELCDVCGWRVAAHLLETVDGDAAARPAPQNAKTQVILATDGPPQSTLREVVTAAGVSMPALLPVLQIIAERFEGSVKAVDQLNRALGEFREQAIVPLREELKYLRFNLGDKVNKTTTNLEVMVDQMDRTIWALLRAQGLTDTQIRDYRTEHGMQPEAPSGQELEIHMTQSQALLDQVAALTAQNQRLLAQLGASHFFWEGEAGEWRYHVGCECQACATETVNFAAAERGASGETRKKEKPSNRRKNRSG